MRLTINGRTREGSDSMTRKKQRVPAQVMRALKRIRQLANYERAGFDFSGGTVTITPGNGPGKHREYKSEHGGRDAVVLAIITETKLYRDSWINPLLDDLEKWAEGDSDALRRIKWHTMSRAVVLTTNQAKTLITLK